MKKTTLLLLLSGLLMFLFACGKRPGNMTHEEKTATLPAKIQPLFKSWKLDVNASSAMNSKAIEAKTGIKSDVKFDKDVGKAAQFLAKTLFFSFEKGTMTRVYSEKFGEGFLSTEETGWLTVDDAAKNITLKDAKGKETSYSIEELSADKLVLAPKGGGSFEVFIPKGQTPSAPAVSDTKAAGSAAAEPAKAAKVVEPNPKYKKTAYKVGDKVVGKWMGSSWYMATIKAPAGDKYTVTWGDGTSGSVAAADMVPLVAGKDLKVGDHVAACWHSCKSAVYMGSVVKKTGTVFSVKWEDGSSPSDVKEGDLTLF